MAHVPGVFPQEPEAAAGAASSVKARDVPFEGAFDGMTFQNAPSIGQSGCPEAPWPIHFAPAKSAGRTAAGRPRPAVGASAAPQRATARRKGVFRLRRSLTVLDIIVPGIGHSSFRSFSRKSIPQPAARLQ